MNFRHSILISGLLSLIGFPSLYAMDATEFNTLKNNIATTLDADVISPGAWRDVTRDISRIDQRGTPTQRDAINTILAERSAVIEKTIENTATSVLSSQQFKKLIAAIATGTIYGVLPSAGFTALSILSGNLDLASAENALINVGIVSALDAFVRYAEEKGGTSPEMGALQAGMISTAVQQFIGFAGPRPADIPLLGPAGRPLIAGLQGVAFGLITRKLNSTGGAKTLLQKINWQDIAQGPENQSIITQHSGAYEFIRNNLSMIVQNETVRSAVATTVTYAVEGAVIGAVMHTLGIGFYDETLPSALANSMARGAMEGLYHFSQHGDRDLGIIQRLHGGFLSATVQRYMQSGIGMSAVDITPVVVQQLTSSAITGIVRQAGGWSNTFKSLYSSAKETFFGGN